MEKKKYTYGFTLGKFMPPHAGHLYLIAMATQQVEFLTVLVCTTTREPIPGALRFSWMQELIENPNITLVHITDDVPSYPHESSEFWPIWEKLMRKHIHPKTEVFFSGESYGNDVSTVLNIDHVCIHRDTAPVASAGTWIRENPFKHWQHIPPAVRPYFVKRIVLTGPESTGKTTLAQRLAEYFNTRWVEEYGREHFDKVHGKLTLDDISIIAKTQIEKEDAAARTANKILFCDTDLIVTQVWSEIYFKECPAWILEENHTRHYDLFLLLNIDLPWVDDGTREFPHLRQFHFNRLQEELNARNLPYRIVSGTSDDRMQHAIQVIENFFFS
jgi:NadR type nicotinamide-nucleotide adenylyltransferase